MADKQEPNVRLKIVAVDPTTPEAAQLIAELTSELAGLYEHAEDGSGDYRPEDVIPKSLFLVGRYGNEAVACGAIRPLEAGVAEVKRMFVKAKYRGRGFSKQILVSLEMAAKEMGYETLRLETGDRQDAAIALYERSGYQQTNLFGMYRHSTQSVCFEKHLQ